MCTHKAPATKRLERTSARGFIISTKRIENFFSPLLDACGSIFEHCNRREVRQNKKVHGEVIRNIESREKR